MVRKIATTMFMSAALVGLPALVGGCDREVSKTTKVEENSRGGTRVEEKKTVEKGDGSIETKTEVKKTNP
jgi:hypothetical protein